MPEITLKQTTRIRTSYDWRDRLNALADAADRTQHGMLSFLIKQEERRQNRRKGKA